MHPSKLAAASFVVATLTSAALADPFGVNLLSNPGAEQDLDGWSVRGDVIAGAWQQPVSGTAVFNTSHSWGVLSQTIHLVDAGFSIATLDAGVNIVFSQWVGARFDANAEYFMRVRLLGADGEELAQKGDGSIGEPDFPFDPEFFGGMFEDEGVNYLGVGLSAGSGWTLRVHSFENVTGVRSVEIEVAGKDAMGWAGYYGAAFDDASLTVAAVPEPANFAGVMGLMAIGVSMLRRPRRG